MCNLMLGFVLLQAFQVWALRDKYATEDEGLGEPFREKDCNEAYKRSHIKMRKGPGAEDLREHAFLKLMSALHPTSDGALDLAKTLQLFRKLEPLFATDNVSPEHWEYAWKHLPSIIMDYAELHFVLHAATSPHVPADPSRGVYVFAGWETEGGAYTDDSRCKAGVQCVVHINMRDLYTDIDEFLSNLLLHMQFLEDSPVMTVQACHDLTDRSKSCRGRGKCWLSIQELSECEGMESKNIKAPHYSVEFVGFNASTGLISQVLVERWLVWANRLKEKASDLVQCKDNELQVHVIQGATEALWVMTSELAMQEHSLMPLRGSYGGRFEQQDRVYGHLLSAMKSNESLMSALNSMNDGKHAYVQLDGPYSVSAEIISMGSWKAGMVDPVVTKELLVETAERRRCAVLLSIGYAFGTSALAMGLALKRSFDNTLRSFYVVGKAGGLSGGVGDYQIPSSFVLWKDLDKGDDAEVFRTDISGVDTSLWSGGGERSIHKGTLMTVPSVVLQGNALLDKAKSSPWHAFGIEMESFWFKRALPDTPGLYLYYTSDIPQAVGASLAHESYPWEEGQTLFNGLVRMALVHMLGLMGR